MKGIRIPVHKMSTARSDLRKKLGAERKHEGGVHAMLVGVTGTGKSEVNVWLDGTRLRVISLVSSGRAS